MAIALILDANGYIAQIADSVALQADSFERNLVVGSTLGAEELRLGSAASLVHSLGDLQVDGFVEVLDTSAPGNPSDAEGRLYKLTGDPGIWWINDSWGTAIDLTAYPKGYVFGLGLGRNSGTPNTQLDIIAGVCRSDDDTTNIISIATITVNIAANGANGLDTGSKANSTWYYTYVIYNPTTRVTAGLLSLSTTSPTMPSGYTKKRRIGSWYINSSGNFRPCTQYDRTGNVRRYRYDEEAFTNCQVLSAGSATSFADVNCASFIPATTTIGIFHITFVGAGTTNFVMLRPNGSTQAAPCMANQSGGATGIGVTGIANSVMEARTDSSRIIEYCNAAASGYAYIWVIGFHEEI
jgi:hypothetical protein